MSQTIVGNLAVELGVSDAQLQAGLAQAVTQSQQAGQKMAAAMNQGSQQAQSGLAKNAQGLLNIGRAIDDVQYGFRGIVNNIEGIVMGLGFSTGVAGAATIAAVAINTMIPAIENVYNSTQKLFAGFQDGAEQARMSVTGLMNGGLGQQGLASALKAQAEFLMGRTDATNFDLTPGMFGDRGSGSVQRRFEAAMAENMRRSVEASALMQEAYRAAANASRELAASQRGAAAQLDLSTNAKAQIPLNQQIFQAAVDRFGNGDNLRTKLFIEGRNQGMMRSETEKLYGNFAMGDQNATAKVVEMLGLQAERTKIMAQSYEDATGSAIELQHIAEKTAKAKEETAKFIEQENRWMENSLRLDEQREAKRQGRIADRQFGEYERAVMRQDDLFKQRDEIMMQRSRSEILGSAAEVFGRNINAGQEDPQLKKLDEIKEEIKNLGTLTGLG